MRFARSLLAAAAMLVSAVSAFGQSSVINSGAVTPGHAPMYVQGGIGSQTVVTDSGPAGGGPIGLGLAELLLTVRGQGSAPYSNAGTGPLGTNACDYDAPINNAAGYHYLCWGPNSTSGGVTGGLISYGAVGAAPLPLNFNINGTNYQFPFAISGIIGPGSSVIGDIAVFNNTTGNLLKDVPALQIYGTQAANTHLAGPTTGAAAFPTFRALVGADLPNPSASTLGGVQSIVAAAHQWIDSISTSGIPHQSQPNFTDLAGNIAIAQIAGGSGASGTTFLRGDNTWAVPTAGRTKLVAPTTFFVGLTGTDQVGCGLASGASACRTRSYLYNNVLAANYDLANQTVTVQLADGTYTDSLQTAGPMLIGQAGGAGLIFTGNCTAGNTNNVTIMPANAVGYAYSADGGSSYRVQCQRLDQTSQRANIALGADIVSIGHGSKIYFGNPSLFAVRPDMWFGCNFTGYNAVTVSFGAQVEFDNDFQIDPGLCQVITTGTMTNGSGTITAVTSTANVVINMGIQAAGVPSDAFVASFVPNTSITLGCIYTSPCQATGTSTGPVTMNGGGQDFLDLGNNAIGNFNTNGDPSFSIAATIGNNPMYLAGTFFINEGSTVNAQAITWVNPSQMRGKCSVIKSISNVDTNLQGIPYIPCNSQQPEFSQNSVSLTANTNSITVGSTSGVKNGQIFADVANPTGTWTAGSATVTVSANTGICNGAKVNAAGILAGAIVTNVSGTTITLGGCGTGPKCVGGNPTYLSETGVPMYFSNCAIAGNATVGFVSSATVFSTNGDTPVGGNSIKATGSFNLWFQGQVIRNSVYD